MNDRVEQNTAGRIDCLETGIQPCEFCATGYHAEVYAFCVRCDAPVCPLCLTLARLSQEPLCPHCRGGGGDS